MDRNENESFIDYVERASEALSYGEIDYEEWAEILTDEIPYSEESLRRCYVLFNKFLKKFENEEFLEYSADEKISQLYKAKEEAQKERMKLLEEKKEIREEYRWKARNELFSERIINAIKNLKPIYIPEIKIKDNLKTGTTALICISDLHAGSTFEIKGLYGETINKYDYNIMQSRLWELLNKFINDDMVYDDIVIAICGDALENILRLSSLTKLKEPVVDTTIKLGGFLAEYIAEFQRQTQAPITVVSCGGNHDINRVLGQKPQLEEENMMKIIVELLKLRLENCPNITVRDYTEVAIENIRGTNIMFQHGEDKDLKVTLDYFDNLYNIGIDEIIAGHMHSPESKTIGITEVGDRVLTRVGSIVGIDAYSKSIRKSARPSAYVAFYTEDGKTWNKNYYL